MLLWEISTTSLNDLNEGVSCWAYDFEWEFFSQTDAI